MQQGLNSGKQGVLIELKKINCNGNKGSHI